MYGLRRGNNNYCANGTGRDLTTYYDAGFRGGKYGVDKVNQHLPQPQPGSPKHFKLNSLGFNARNEGFQQTFNCSRSVKKMVDEKTGRMTVGSLPNFAPSTEAQPQLLQSRSDPALTGSGHGWQRSTGLAATAAYMDLHQSPLKSSLRGASGLSTPKARRHGEASETWTAELFIPSRGGFARNPGGGVWPN
eukprot:TRINITY_DN13070_c0_g1_i1.p1 TRINITY_DN13070_c0_g1~~TRINITY_DN13070_c0_g1_i1.p1  ORF type:complete len:191 (+),score=28.78 TRINITY_DN13070_c0_g1_i1:98-670(+)